MKKAVNVKGNSRQAYQDHKIKNRYQCACTPCQVEMCWGFSTKKKKTEKRL